MTGVGETVANNWELIQQKHIFLFATVIHSKFVHDKNEVHTIFFDKTQNYLAIVCPYVNGGWLYYFNDFQHFETRCVSTFSYLYLGYNILLSYFSF